MSKKGIRSESGVKTLMLRLLFYIAMVILGLVIIVNTYQISRVYFYHVNYLKGYSEAELYTDFVDGNVNQLISKISYNQGIGCKISEETAPYYAYTTCYNSAVNYHMYEVTNQQEKAKEELEVFRENETKLTNKVFRDALEKIIAIYQIPK